MRTAAILLVAGVLLSAAAAPASAGDGTWVKLGSRVVAPTAERDVIKVTAWEGKFNAIRLNVANRAVHMIDLKIHFRNGATQDVILRSNIRVGGHTRVIDLPGTDRVITQVTLTYKTRSRFPGKAVVSLWGRRVSGAVVVAPKPQPATAPTWVLLGSRHVNFIAEKDAVPVTAAEGRFTKLQLEVWESGVEIIDLKVRFGNNTFVDYAIKAFIPKGGKTRVLDLPGDDRVIKQVNLVYRSRGIRSGRALVRVWGLNDAVVVPPKPPVQPKPPTPVAGTWVKLGSRLVAGRAEKDVIMVTGVDGRFTKIKLLVGGKRVKILDLKVHFGDGGTQDVALRSEIPAGGSTRVIDLVGGARVINRVSLVYKHLGRRIGQPVVTLMGMR